MSRPARGILDTNVVILLPRLRDPDSLPQEPLISAVTLAELSVGPHVAATRVQRANRQAHLQQAEADFDVLPFDGPAARAFGRVVSDLQSAGRRPAARFYDMLIAATAIANRLPLYTVNPRDFTGIRDLQLVEVPHPDRT